MNTSVTLTIATLGLIAIAGTAAAQTTPAPAPDPVRHHQQLRQRIRTGVEAGQLTPGEVRRLRTRMAAVRARGQALRQANATPTLDQRRDLRRRWLQINRMVFRLKHNRNIR